MKALISKKLPVSETDSIDSESKTGTSFTYKEASELEEIKLSETLLYFKNVVDQLDISDEEKSNIMVNLSHKLGEWRSMIILRGVLMEEADYIHDTFGEEYADMVSIEEVPDDE